MMFSKQRAGGGATGRAFPMFQFGFAVLMAANSAGLIPDVVRAVLSDASRRCLIIAVAALGVRTSLRDVFKVGPRPFAVMVLQTAFLTVLVIAAIFAFPGTLGPVSLALL